MRSSVRNGSNEPRSIAFVALLTLGWLGCGTPAPSVPDSGVTTARDSGVTTAPDAGPPPAFEDCFEGAIAVDCGGDGPPRLGCVGDGANEGEECRWFVSGVVAADYVASRCAAEDLCCESFNADSDGWPFPPETTRDLNVASFLYAYGLSPWDNERSVVIPVEIDPSFAQVSALEASCEGGPSWIYLPRPETNSNPCVAGNLLLNRRILDTVVLSVQGDTRWGVGSLVGFRVTAELIGDRARVCRRRYTDAFRLSCTTRMPSEPNMYSDPQCAQEGRVVLDSTPTDRASVDALHGAIEVTFPDGLHLQAQF